MTNVDNMIVINVVCGVRGVVCECVCFWLGIV